MHINAINYCEKTAILLHIGTAAGNWAYYSVACIFRCL